MGIHNSLRRTLRSGNMMSNIDHSCAKPNKSTMTRSLLVLLMLLLSPTIFVPSSAAVQSGNDNVKTSTSGSVATTSKDIDVVSARSDSGNATAAAVVVVGGGGESATVSGYGIAQTLDFAETAATDRPPSATSVAREAAVIHSQVGISNGHQNGMLLMAMMLDNKSNIESKDTKPALALFDFNPEDIQDLAGNDFYEVDGQGNSTEADNEVGATSEKEQMSSTTEATDLDNDSLWTLPENPLTMPLVMKTNGQALPGAAMGGSTEAMLSGDDEGRVAEPETDQGNIFKVKLKRRQEAKKRERHFSISSRMNILGNEMTTIAQFQTLISMFDHWEWNEEAIADHVSHACERDMNTYLASLKAGELWALKGE